MSAAPQGFVAPKRYDRTIQPLTLRRTDYTGRLPLLTHGYRLSVYSFAAQELRERLSQLGH